jgi:hypothetical protein
MELERVHGRTELRGERPVDWTLPISVLAFVIAGAIGVWLSSVTGPFLVSIFL